MERFLCVSPHNPIVFTSVKRSPSRYVSILSVRQAAYTEDEVGSAPGLWV